MEAVVLIIGLFLIGWACLAITLKIIHHTPQPKSDPFWDWFFGSPPGKTPELRPTLGEEHRLRFISERVPLDPWTCPEAPLEDTDLRPKRYDPRVYHAERPWQNRSA